MSQDNHNSVSEEERKCPKCAHRIKLASGQMYHCSSCGRSLCYNCSASNGWRCPDCNTTYAHMNPGR